MTSYNFRSQNFRGSERPLNEVQPSNGNVYEYRDLRLSTPKCRLTCLPNGQYASSHDTRHSQRPRTIGTSVDAMTDPEQPHVVAAERPEVRRVYPRYHLDPKGAAALLVVA